MYVQVLAFDFDGLMIINRVGQLRETGIPESVENREYVLEVGAGKSLQQLAMETARMGWSGLEFAAGIPASIGGMPPSKDCLSYNEFIK